MRLVFWLFVLVICDEAKAVLLFQRPIFDCRRIPPSYCCSSRVRRSCPELCGGHPCTRQRKSNNQRSRLILVKKINFLRVKHEI